MTTLTVLPNAWMVTPFLLLLALIALAPLAFSDWWQRHYPKVTLGLAALTLAGYVGGLHAWGRALHTGIEYVSFICLIGSLFVVSGGIHITVQGEATPRANVVFLAVGAVVANLLGTTGASMLLIRPWLRLNRYRLTSHHIVFFIFIVSNVGGCLTPIGDPPLFLGYLKGIPFWWIAARCWPMWAMGVGILLALFYWIDRRNYLRAPAAVRAHLAEPTDRWRFEGVHNLGFLAVILGSVFISRPAFLRETLMVGATLGSFWTTRSAIHQANHFNLHPIREVAILFAGIFATMMPALDWLQAHAAAFGAPTPTLFYWGSGLLSSVLDNAPTYLSFLSAEFGAFATPDLLQQVSSHLQTHGTTVAVLHGAAAEPVRRTVELLAGWHGVSPAPLVVSPERLQVAVLLGDPLYSRILTAISVGAVFFGANTYIGNGPNFMVKAIADQQKARTPSFVGYVVRFTLPFMAPTLLAVWWVFFR